jgi:predicted RNase H-like HicB family nuclease
MNVSFAIHLEPTETDVVWWAESGGMPGWSATAPTLRELRTLIEEAVRLYISEEVEIAMGLVPDLPDAPGLPEGAPAASPGSYAPAVLLATARRAAA